MTAISLALAFLGALAFVAWRDWLRLQRPIPPHEDLVRRVAKLEDQIPTIAGFARIRMDEEHGRPFGG